MATSALTAKFAFDDYETYSVTFSPYATTSQAVQNFKAKVKQFNAEVADTISDTFITESGGHLTGIQSAQIVTSQKTVFYTRE